MQCYSKEQRAIYLGEKETNFTALLVGVPSTRAPLSHLIYFLDQFWITTSLDIGSSLLKLIFSRPFFQSFKHQEDAGNIICSIVKEKKYERRLLHNTNEIKIDKKGKSWQNYKKVFKKSKSTEKKKAVEISVEHQINTKLDTRNLKEKKHVQTLWNSISN